MASERTRRTAVVLNDTRIERHHGCSLVMQSILRLAQSHGLRITATSPVRSDWRKQPKVLAAMEAADLIIVNGEGTIHHDAPHGETLLLAGAYARERGKVAVLINATWEANSPRFAELARQFQIVSVRETASARELAAAGVPCRVVPDLALGSAELLRHPQSRHGIAFTDNAVTTRTLAQYAAMRRLGARPLSLLFGRLGPRFAAASLRRYLRAGASIRSAWLAVLHDRSSQQPDREEFLRTLSSRKLVVSGRFHTIIMCLATATPFLAARSNTHKIEAVLADVGLASWRLPDLDRLDSELLDRASRWEPGEIEQIKAYVSKGTQAMNDLFQDILALLEPQAPRASRIGTGAA